MKIGMPVQYAGDFLSTVAGLRDFEAAGLDAVTVPEAYTFDSVSQMGFIAASTQRLVITSGILNIYSRSPSLLGMTAAGLDDVSGGRFELGIGASGPQVIEGFHGIPYDAPVGRTREVVDVCRQVWRRDPVELEGRYFQIPYRKDEGSPPHRPLRLINKPLRARVPMTLAALGPRNVELAAELFEGWEPIFYLPEKADEVFGESLRRGAAKRDHTLPALDVCVDTRLLLTDDPHEISGALWRVRQHLALYIGGMGSRKANFYRDLAARFGYETESLLVQDHFLSGRKQEAAEAVPEELARGVSLVGPPSWVRERLKVLAASGVGRVNVVPLAADHRGRVDDVERLRLMAD